MSQNRKIGAVRIYNAALLGEDSGRKIALAVRQNVYQFFSEAQKQKYQKTTPSAYSYD